MRKWRAKERKCFHWCIGMGSELFPDLPTIQYFSCPKNPRETPSKSNQWIWVLLANLYGCPCLFSENENQTMSERARLVICENRQDLIDSISDRSPVLWLLSAANWTVAPFEERGPVLLGLNIKETEQCLSGLQPDCSLPRCCSDTRLFKGWCLLHWLELASRWR